MGFHYPIETYLEEVKKSLKPDGVLIIDVRKDSGGLEVLKKNFSVVEVIYERQKQQRILAKST